MFLFSDRENSFSVCTCAKCGSTSLFMTLYALISGSKNTRQGPPWIHEFVKWNFPNVSSSTYPGKLHLIMTRDPVERYVSAFHSKVKCCRDNRTSCYKDRGDDFVPSLATLAGGARRNCLTFDEYVNALERVQKANKESSLNAHFQPQDIACPIPRGTPTLVFDVSVAGDFLAKLRGFELHATKFIHAHATRRDIVYDTTRLRAIAEREYTFVDRV